MGARRAQAVAFAFGTTTVRRTPWSVTLSRTAVSLKKIRHWPAFTPRFRNWRTSFRKRGRSGPGRAAPGGERDVIRKTCERGGGSAVPGALAAGSPTPRRARSGIVAPRVRTLVISDLHLGSRLERDVLRHPQPLAALLRALDDVDRLVLLGDVVELLEGRATQAMAIAEPVLRAIGARIGADREIVLVPGNHDRPLVRRWLRATGGPDEIDARIPPNATPGLARVVAALEPAPTRVHYPGVWLADGVWATHGHYLDRHLLPESGYGVGRGLLGRVPRDGATPAEYERARSPSLARVERVAVRAPRPLAAAWDDLAEIMRASTMPGIHRRVLRRRLAPLTSFVLGLQMRRASLPALGRVVHRLGVDADHVVFGHVHRSGPLAADDPRRWRGPGGTPNLVNTGSWVYESLLVHRARPPHPYWPGGAVVIEDDGPPRAVGLLDHLGPRALHPH